MDTLPEEILIEIFTYLGPQDLISVTLVCRLFSYLVDNTKLSRSLTIYFPNHKHTDFWEVHRKYTNIQIKTDGHPQAFIPSSIFNKHVKTLTIKNAAVTGDILARMLEFCENLKIVRLENVTYYGNLYSTIGRYNAPPKPQNLQLEMIGSEFRVLKILGNCRVRSLLLENYHNHHEYLDVEPLAEFFEKQNELRELKIRKFCQNIFARNKYSDEKLKVEKLAIREVFIPRDDCFENFMSKFYDNLQALEIEKINVKNLGDVLTKFEKLEELKLSLNDKVMRQLPKLDKIERLTVSRKRMPKRWLEKYPNLKKLKLEDENLFDFV